MVSDGKVAYIRGKGIAFQLIRRRHLPADQLLWEEGISIQTCPQMEISECVRRGKSRNGMSTFPLRSTNVWVG
jgi:hypothetical protein